MNRTPHHRRLGLTLLEVVTALMVFSILSIGAYTLLAGSMNTDRYLRAANTTESEIELASRRITHNLRTASAITTPSNTLASNTLTLTTQPDTANGYASGVTVTYALRADPTNAKNTQLIETDQRYGTNVLLNNVESFSVTFQTLTSPRVIKVSLKTTAPQVVTRSFQITCRNL